MVCNTSDVVVVPPQVIASSTYSAGRMPRVRMVDTNRFLVATHLKQFRLALFEINPGGGSVSQLDIVTVDTAVEHYGIFGGGGANMHTMGMDMQNNQRGVVAYQKQTNDTDSTSGNIWAAEFEVDDDTISVTKPPFQVTTLHEADHHYAPTVAVAPDGSAMVAWHRSSPTVGAAGVWARCYSPKLEPMGEEFLAQNTSAAKPGSYACLEISSSETTYSGETGWWGNIIWRGPSTSSDGYMARPFVFIPYKPSGTAIVVQ